MSSVRKVADLRPAMDAKRAPLMRSSPARLYRHPFLLRPRSRFARLVLFDKVDYLQWVCAVAVFFFVVIAFEAFLPASLVEKSGKPPGVQPAPVLAGLGDGVRLPPLKMWERLKLNRSVASFRPSGVREALRKPKLAVVLPFLAMDGMELLMVSLVKFLHELGYLIELYALEGGPASTVWRSVGFPVKILQINGERVAAVDWLIYDGVLVNSLEGKEIVSCLLQEPFKSVPLIWTIHETALALRSRNYTLDWQIQLANHWKRAFNRATVVVFPNYYFPVMYSAYDGGNYFVIPVFASEALEAESFFPLENKNVVRSDMGYTSEDVIIAIVGSQFLYSGLWVEHTLVLQALLPLVSKLSSDTTSKANIKVGIMNANLTGAYKVALEAIVLNLGFPEGSVRQIAVDGDFNNFLSVADLVLYGSFLEEQSFPPVLVQAMSLGKAVIAPDLDMIRKHVVDRVSGYLFPKDNMEALTRILFHIVPNGKMSHVAVDVALMGKSRVTNFMVTETLEGYAMLLEYILKLPSGVSSPKDVMEIPASLKVTWHWQLFRKSTNFKHAKRTSVSYSFLDKVERSWNQHLANGTHTLEEAFSVTDWEDEKAVEMANTRKKREEEELKERMDQPRGTWEDVYRNVKKADRSKNELHETDEQELERTGQPLCIYEPYFGEGTWTFLHHTTLYRGVGLSTDGLRPGADDINASSRLPILSDPYYRDILGDYGAFFAVANRIDRIHKNAWIGFQSWRVIARKESLSKDAERALLEAVETQRHGDAFYFWVHMDNDPRNPSQQDFWSFCDSINAGNCKYAVSEALGKMYRIKDRKGVKIPPMPKDGGSWSVMCSWVLPTRSFLEFVMFSRMFVDALDAQMYNQHHGSGHCLLALYEDRHCYSRVLELMVNVWAYHSARRIIYVNPETGTMTEHHQMHNRRGKMWVNWFSFSTLKSMDEDLAEELDIDKPNCRWLWPSTGEVFWKGTYERERYQRYKLKEKRKKESRDKISRIIRRQRQKTLGKYVKPPPEDTALLNSTLTANLSKF